MAILDPIESWRWPLAVILLASNVAVWVGVYLENENFSEATKNAGWAMLLRGLAAETVAAFFLFSIDTSIQNASDARVESLRSANLALEAQIQPRRLTKADLAGIISALTAFKGRAVKVSSPATDLESAVVADQVVQALRLAGVVPFDRSMTRQVFGGIGFGVLVSGSDKPLVDAIVRAFSKSLGAAAGDIPRGVTTVLPSGEDAIATDATIFVGVKPLAKWPDWP